MNNSSWAHWQADLDAALTGKITTGVVMCMSIFLNGFVFLVALFSKRLRKSGFNMTTISLSFTDFLLGLSIRPLISLMSNSHPVSYNSCAVALAAYTTCIQASSFHVLIIACLRCYAIKKTSLTIFRFELRNAILAIAFTWFLALCSTSLTFLILSRKTFPSVSCTVKNVFGENFKLYMKLHSMILILCSIGLISLYIILGLKLYTRQINYVHPLRYESRSLPADKTNNTVSNGYLDNVSNSSLVTVREMELPKKDSETIEGACEKMYNKGILVVTNKKQSNATHVPVGICLSDQELKTRETSTGKMNPSTDKSVIFLRTTDISKISDKIVQQNPNVEEEYETNRNIKPNDSTYDENERKLSDRQHHDQELSHDTKNKASNSFLNTIKSRNQKSLITVSIIVLLHMILNGPYYLFLFAEGYFIETQGDTVVRTVLFCISILHSVFNPLVYVARIPGFREFIKDKIRNIKDFLWKAQRDNEKNVVG